MAGPSHPTHHPKYHAKHANHKAVSPSVDLDHLASQHPQALEVASEEGRIVRGVLDGHISDPDAALDPVADKFQHLSKNEQQVAIKLIERQNEFLKKDYLKGPKTGM